MVFPMPSQNPVKECLAMTPSFFKVQLWRHYCGPRVELGLKGSAVVQAVHVGRRKRPGSELINLDLKEDS